MKLIKEKIEKYGGVLQERIDENTHYLISQNEAPIGTPAHVRVVTYTWFLLQLVGDRIKTPQGQET